MHRVCPIGLVPGIASTISSETGAIDDDAALAFPCPAFWAQDMNLAPRFKPEIKMHSHYKGNSHGDGSKAILSSIIIIIIIIVITILGVSSHP